MTRSRLSRAHVVLLLTTTALVAAIAGGRAQSPTDIWWTGYGRGADGSRYIAARQINKANVSQLQVAWTYAFGDTTFVPSVVRGVAYGRGRNGSLVAVDAASGKELWIREHMNGMTTRGINYWESANGSDRRLIFAMDSLLQEVDAKTGQSIMTFGTNGVVDLRVGLDGRDPASIGAIQTNTPGGIFQNLIIVGSATGEGYMSPPGDIRAYDIRDGRLVWTFHTVPRPGEYGYDTWPKDAWKYIGGVNNWGEMSVDTARGIAYIPLGSPTYDFYGVDRIGSGLFGTSIVALDARTGKRRWHFQLVHHDLWDMDPSAAPQLTTIRQNGRNRDVVAVTGKTGWLYVFDRVTGEPIWPIEEKPFPKSEMEGEQSWPTQPVPTILPPYIRHTFTVEDVSPFLSPEEADAFKKRLAAADNKGVFTPISLKDTVHVPTSNGGTLFGGAASDPGGSIYIVAHDNPGIMRLEPPQEPRAGGAGGGGGSGGRGRGALPESGAPPELVAGSGSAWTRPAAEGGRGRGSAPYPEGTPSYTKYVIVEYNTVANRIKPPFTTIVKYDLNQPALKWQIPFGDDPALAARGITDTGSPATNNGIIVTEGGLVFGAGKDNQIRAWDSETGKLLWASRFGGNFIGSPVMYQMNGKQYLLVPASSTIGFRGFGVGPAAGAAPAAEPTAPMGWIAYALPGK